ncbi:hypothetical protein GPM59_001908 [Salmonella enterica]|nr:hypothetical protein [Salmonella enterica subsp. enterica]EDS6428368.1 hypothetical protein [Salmonella enterica subsp. enterica]EDY4902255.1 hypothetical protein [Salmonella enterica]EDZ0485787.1 hypothetical protein [Salmonella enterica]
MHKRCGAACVTLSLCATKVTHGSGAVGKHCVSGAGLRSRGSKACCLCRPQPVKLNGAEYQQVQVCRRNPGAGAVSASKKQAALRSNDKLSQVKYDLNHGGAVADGFQRQSSWGFLTIADKSGAAFRSERRCCQRQRIAGGSVYRDE